MTVRWRRLPFIALSALIASGVLSSCSSLIGDQITQHVYANVIEGDRQLTLGNTASARTWFDRAVTLAPHSIATYLGPHSLDNGDTTGGIIWSLTQHNDWPDMENYLAKATQAPQLSNQWLIWAALAGAQQQMGETQAARLSYQQQLSAMDGKKSGALMSVDPLVFHLQHADALWNSGQTSAGRDELLHLIAHHPDAASEAQNQLAYAEAVSNVNLPEAARLSAAAVAATRQSGQGDEVLGEFLDTQGWVEYRQKQYGAALVDLQEALEYIPREPVSHYHLAEVYQALGQSQAAQIEIHRASYLAPSDFDTKVALQQIMPGSPMPAGDTAAAPSAA